MKNILKYIISLLIALGLLWYVFRDIDGAALLAELQKVQYGWVLGALGAFMISNVMRAYRWNLLLQPLGYRHLTTFRTLLAILVGYFANLLFPRMGEVTRCGILKRTDDVPLTTSLGTVVAERVIDLVLLLLIAIVLFIVEFQRLSTFFLSFAQTKVDNVGVNVFAIYIVAGILLVGIILFFFFGKIKKRLRQNSFYQKISAFAKEMVTGITSIRYLEQKAVFWILTVATWVCYFFMSYLIFHAIPETSHLGVMAGISVLVMGSLGMAAPVQGGVGTFHALVSGVLILYGIGERDGVLFATVAHGLQMLAVIVFGAISFFWASTLSTRRAKAKQTQEPLTS